MKENLVQYVLKGARTTFVLRCGGLGVSFLSHTWFAPLLGQEQYGVYAYVLAWVSVLALATTLGLDTLLTRLSAVYRMQADWPRLQGLWTWSRSTGTRAAGLLLAVGLAGMFTVFAGIDPGRHETFLVGLPLVFVLTSKSLRQGALRGLRLVVQSETLDNVVRPLGMLGVMGLFAWGLGERPRAVHLMGANLAACTLALGLGLLLLARAWPQEARASTPQTEPREWRQTALPLLITAGVYLLLSRTDILMLGLLAGNDSSATYSVVTRFSDLLSLGLVSSTAMIGPVSAELHQRGDRAELQAVVTKAVQWASALTLAMGLVLVFFGRPLLGLFGPEYVEGFAPLMLLLVGQAANALAGPVGYLLSMTGHQNRVVQVLGGSALLNAGLNAALIPAFGVLGAALATTTTNLIWNLVLHVSVARRLGIDSTALGRDLPAPGGGSGDPGGDA